MPGIVYAEPGHLPKPADNQSAMDGPAQIGALADRHAELFTALSTAERDALAGVDLWDGRRIWNWQTARLEVYDAAESAWVTAGPRNHSELSGLGFDDHPQYIRKALVTAKGDLLVGTASGVVARKPVGADGWLLVGDSTAADGVGWSPRAVQAARLGRTTASQSIPHATSTVVTWDTEQIDTGGMADLAAQPTRITVQKPGLHLITWHVSFDTEPTGRRSVTVLRDGFASGGQWAIQNAVSGSDHYQTGSLTTIDDPAGTYYELQVYQDSGAPLNVKGTSSVHAHFAMIAFGAV